MRTLTRLMAFSLWMALATGAHAQDTTSKPAKEQTVFGLGFLRGAHFDLGAGAVPYLRSQPGSTVEGRIGIVFQPLPDWTFAYVSSTLEVGDTTSYVAPNSNGYHPLLDSRSKGLEVQRRWNAASLVHPMVTAGIGTLENSYPYWEYPAGGGQIYHRDGTASTTYYEVAGGGELNLTGWMRLILTVGYRQAGSYALQSGSMSNSGSTVKCLLEFGRF